MNDNHKKYLNEIICNLEEYSYRSKRYYINFAVVLVFCPKDINLSDLVDIRRKTDKYIALENNLCCVVFDCIDSESSIKATQNLEAQLNKNCLNEDYFLCAATSIEHESTLKMVNSLFEMLEAFAYNLEVNNGLAAIS